MLFISSDGLSRAPGAPPIIRQLDRVRVRSGGLESAGFSVLRTHRQATGQDKGVIVEREVQIPRIADLVQLYASGPTVCARSPVYIPGAHVLPSFWVSLDEYTTLIIRHTPIRLLRLTHFCEAVARPLKSGYDSERGRRQAHPRVDDDVTRRSVFEVDTNQYFLQCQSCS
jgi:hypothetical protein